MNIKSIIDKLPFYSTRLNYCAEGTFPVYDKLQHHAKSLGKKNIKIILLLLHSLNKHNIPTPIKSLIIATLGYFAFSSLIRMPGDIVVAEYVLQKTTTYLTSEDYNKADYDAQQLVKTGVDWWHPIVH